MSPLRLQLKLREDASAGDRERVLGGVVQQGATAVEPLFPGTRSPSRASMFVVDLDERAAPAVRGFLEGDQAVEYTEPEVQRSRMR